MCTHNPALQGSEQEHHPGQEKVSRGAAQRSKASKPQAESGMALEAKRAVQSRPHGAVLARALQGFGQRMAGVEEHSSGCLREDSQGWLPIQEVAQNNRPRALGWPSRAGPEGQHQAWLLFSSKLLETPHSHTPREALSM